MGLSYSDYHDPDGTGWRQRDLTVRQTYDRTYLEVRYREIEANVRALARRRAEVLAAFVPARGRLLDFGCGTGHVVRAARRLRRRAWGHDLVRYADDIPFLDRWDAGGPWDGVTFFDVLEHLPDPAAVVRRLGAEWVMVSVPWCHYPADWDWLRRWRHLRPGEHLWHWGRETLDRFFAALGYGPVMHSCFEDDYRPRYDPALENVLTALYRR